MFLGFRGGGQEVTASETFRRRLAVAVIRAAVVASTVGVMTATFHISGLSAVGRSATAAAVPHVVQTRTDANLRA